MRSHTNAMSARHQGSSPYPVGDGHGGAHSALRGLTLPVMNVRMSAMRSRLKAAAGSATSTATLREVSERKQVGDAEGMVNEERGGKGASSEGLEQM